VSVSHTALDGSTAIFDGLRDETVPAVSVMNIRVGQRSFEFTTGIRELGRWVAEEVEGIPLTETFSVRGAIVHVGVGTTVGGDGIPAPRLIGVWEGKDCSLVTHSSWSRNSADMLTLFEQFTILEVPGGTTVLVRRGALARMDEPPMVAKRVPDLGIIEVVPATNQSVRLLPRQRGTAVRGGELFADRMGRDNELVYYILAGTSAIATVIPQPNLDLDLAARQLADLAVEWRAAA